MATKKLRSAAATVRLIIVMARLFEEETPNREVTRFRFGGITIRRVGRRSYLTGPFLADLAEEASQLGWIFIPITSDLFAMLRADKAVSWIKISSKRLSMPYTELLDGPVATAYREFLEKNDMLSITELSDEEIVEVYDGAVAADLGQEAEE